MTARDTPESLLKSDQPLFRDEALLEHDQRFIGRIVMVRPVSLRILMLCCAIATIMVVVFVCIAHVTRRERATGTLSFDHKTAHIFSPSAGVVLKRLVKEGDAVKAGDPLYVISSDRQSAALGETETVVATELRLRRSDRASELEKEKSVLQEQLASLRRKSIDLSAQRDELLAEEQTQGRRVDINTRDLERLRKLTADGFYPVNQLQDREQDNLDQQGRLRSIRSQRMALQGQIEDTESQLKNFPLTMANTLSAIERDIAGIGEEVAQSEGRRQIVVNSEIDGTVTAALIDRGQYVTPATLLVSVVPKGAMLQAQLDVPSSAIGFIHIGNAVLLRYAAFPYQKFGQYQAEVTIISKTALQPSDLQMLDANKESYYRVIAKLGSQSIEAYGAPAALQDGMKFDAILLLERRKIYEWILEPLHTIKDRMDD